MAADKGVKRQRAGVAVQRAAKASTAKAKAVGANLSAAELSKIIALYADMGAFNLAPSIIAAIVGFPKIFKLDGLGDANTLAGVVGNSCVTAISWQVNCLLENTHPLTGEHVNLEAEANSELCALVKHQLAPHRNQLIQLGASVGYALLSEGHLDAVKVLDVVFGTPTCVMVTDSKLRAAAEDCAGDRLPPKGKSSWYLDTAGQPAVHTILEDWMFAFDIDNPKGVITNGTCSQDQLIGRDATDQPAPDQQTKDRACAILAEIGAGPMLDEDGGDEEEEGEDDVVKESDSDFA